MIRLKKQLSLLTFLSLALTPNWHNICAISQTNCLYVDSETIATMDPVELVWRLEELYDNFLNIEDYPEISLRQFGDTLIQILDAAGARVPHSLKEHVRSLINVKKESAGIAELRSGHRLVNDILLQLTTMAIEFLNDGTSPALQNIPAPHLLTMKRELHKYKREIEHLTGQNKMRGLSELIDDSQKLFEKMKPIWQDWASKNSDLTDQIIKKRTSTSKSEGMNQVQKTARLIKVYSHRIARNKIQ